MKAKTAAVKANSVAKKAAVVKPTVVKKDTSAQKANVKAAAT